MKPEDIVDKIRQGIIDFIDGEINILEKVEELIGHPHHRRISSFRIVQHHHHGGHHHMALSQSPLIGIAPGATGTFSGIPIDSLGNSGPLPAGIVPTWVTSDPIFVATPTVDGLTVTVAVPADATPGTVFTLAISAALADGSNPTSGPVNCPVTTIIPPPFVVASFVIQQVN